MDFKAFKMDGLGNDFVIIDQRHNEFELTNDQIKKICNRNFIGCDQLIYIKKNDMWISNINCCTAKMFFIVIINNFVV